MLLDRTNRVLQPMVHWCTNCTLICSMHVNILSHPKKAAGSAWQLSPLPLFRSSQFLPTRLVVKTTVLVEYSVCVNDCSAGERRGPRKGPRHGRCGRLPDAARARHVRSQAPQQLRHLGPGRPAVTSECWVQPHPKKEKNKEPTAPLLNDFDIVRVTAGGQHHVEICRKERRDGGFHAESIGLRVQEPPFRDSAGRRLDVAPIALG